MGCISPQLIRTKKERLFVPCGKCNFCMQKKRSDWTFRLLMENKQAETANFLTLTYDDSRLPLNARGIPELRKTDLQLFTKRIRFYNDEKWNVPLRYYSVGEYGTRTLRPHYHSIMFNIHPDILPRVAEIWGHGNCHIGEVNQASIHYVTKYVINRTVDYGDRAPPLSHMSRRPGIGAQYLFTHKEWHRAGMRNYTQVNGQQSGLPRYYKDKIFSKAERGRMGKEYILLDDSEYWQELDRLHKTHDDPYLRYDEGIRNAHDKIISKVNQTNQF